MDGRSGLRSGDKDFDRLVEAPAVMRIEGRRAKGRGKGFLGKFGMVTRGKHMVIKGFL